MQGRLLLLSMFVLVSVHAVHAESKNPADYPLRIHIFNRNQTAFYHNHMEEEAKGDGRANLFENGEPRGVDFSFECSDKLRSSLGYETYPAKWKKQGQELTVLLPLFGKTGAYWTCNLKTGLKDVAYVSHNGNLSTEPVADFKSWMVKHDYDPEHGKVTPIRSDPPAAPATSTPPTAPQP